MTADNCGNMPLIAMLDEQRVDATTHSDESWWSPIRRYRPAGSAPQHEGAPVPARAARFRLEGDRLRRHGRLRREHRALAFLYNGDRVHPSGLVGEIVLPPIGTDPARQFARTPYFAGFTRAGTEFTLASVHVLWGRNAAERLPEVTAFAQWMRDSRDRPNDWNHNLMVLGDFNLDRIGDPSTKPS